MTYKWFYALHFMRSCKATLRSSEQTHSALKENGVSVASSTS